MTYLHVLGISYIVLGAASLANMCNIHPTEKKTITLTFCHHGAHDVVIGLVYLLTTLLYNH